MEFVDYLNKVIREVTGREENTPEKPIIDNTPLKDTQVHNSPIVEGLKFGKYKVLSIERNKVYCTIGGVNKCYTIKEIEMRYDKWKESKKRKREKEKAWDNLSLTVKERDAFKCTNCGADKDTALQLHAHHIIPKGKGGKDELNNLTTLCIECHAKAHDGTVKGDFLKRRFYALKNPTLSDYIKYPEREEVNYEISRY